MTNKCKIAKNVSRLAPCPLPLTDKVITPKKSGIDEPYWFMDFDIGKWSITVMRRADPGRKRYLAEDPRDYKWYERIVPGTLMEPLRPWWIPQSLWVRIHKSKYPKIQLKGGSGGN